MGYSTIHTYTVSNDYDEHMTLDEMLAHFARILFNEDFITINTLYDKESGEVFKRLSVSISKETQE